jgi:hypothetical protein
MTDGARPARARFPSLGAALDAALATLRRFPLVLAAGAAAAAAAILAREDIGPDWLRDRLLVAGSLGIPLLIAVALLGERLRSTFVRLLAVIGALAVLLAVHLAWAGWTGQVQMERYLQLSAGFHLLVAFLPFAGRDRPTAFWQYNRALLVRFVVAGVSSATLFVGLALALAALQKLFGVDLPQLAYFRLWVVTAFVFNTWFFLGGVPADLDALDARPDYPAYVRVFAQYTLVPLVTVYLVILTVYFGKVLVLWDWPSGWIGYLVSGVAGAGILALLLVHPLAEREDQRWIAVFARGFWIGIMPAILMLWLAIYQRVHQYGFTEPRYFLLLLSLWLAGMALYYTVTRSRRIRVIPASLCVVALATFGGPWGAYQVAERSQLGRLRVILERDGMLRGGRARRPAAPVSRDDAQAISATVRYVAETHGTSGLGSLLGDSLADSLGLGGRRSARVSEARVQTIVEALGVAYVPRWASGGRPSFSYRADERRAVPLAGYDYLLRIRVEAESTAVRDTGLVALLRRGSRSLQVMRGGEVLVDVPLDSMLVRARAAAGRRASGVLPAALLRAEAAGPRAHAVVLLRDLSGQGGPPAPTVTNAIGDVLVRLGRRR